MLLKIRNVTKLNCKMCYTMPKEIIPNLSWEKFNSLTHQKRIQIYLDSAEHIARNKPYIPKQYFTVKKNGIADNLYLVDCRIAKDIVKQIIPLMKYSDQIICDTNAGLGFLTEELLENGIQKVRLYENCSEFRATLKGFTEVYPDRVDLFVKDIFHIWKLSLMDKMDKGDRVSQLLKGLAKSNWSDDPVTTIIGTMSNLSFLSYVFKMIALQNEIAQYGRMELFVIMRPVDYLKLTAGPQFNLRVYQPISILSNLFCNFKLIEKYPRLAFLPWESRIYKLAGSPRMHDADKLYLVHIEFKKELPLKADQLLPFHFFSKQLFGRGNITVIQKMEEWCPGIGEEIILLDKYDTRNIDIYSKTGKITPVAILELFKILYNHPEYRNTSLHSLVEAELLKYETVESYLAGVQTTARRK